ncbi:hypothetical protein PCE31106_00358 [Pandoraea cepalis]|uniref:Uncharacterized protein n=1 Tax=Pandoraea cepalis TaxID=2508294 RepID=A0A5E4RUU6_9BURK|nr:hypothetical protein [Pandoraea cepalis]VVD66244.1 hypothetical protein PCE31106_00358 [Pandoraea cepalis]
MPLASHYRDMRVAPAYGLPHMPRHHGNKLSTAAGWRRAFRGAHATCHDETGLSAPLPRERAKTSRSSEANVWPAALAIMLVANLAVPAAARVPWRSRHARDGESADTQRAGALDADALPPAHTGATSASEDVIIRAVRHSSTVKSDYSLHDVLSAVASARAPFHYLWESVGDTYEILSGRRIDPQVRRGVQQGADVLDVATAVLPGVRLLRLPGDLADIADDALEGKPPDPGKLAGFLQYADPRMMGSVPRTHGDSLAREKGKDVDVGDAVDAVDAGKAADAVEPVEPVDAIDPESVARAPLPPAGHRAIAPAPARRPRIVDEHARLNGYAQSLPLDQRPNGETSLLVVVDGHHYLRGEAGYYRANRGISADHWLIDAPPGSEQRAQVPVTYEPGTGTWHAHAPLRLCGGGCGPSRPDAPPDSIANSVEDILTTIRHVPDARAQRAIQNAFSDLSALHLRRTNRADLQSGRDNSIVDHRIALSGAMRKRIDPNAPLIKQQQIASTITAAHYGWREAGEAFCQENAEILFHSLLEHGISRDQIRMITIKPHNKPSHVAVLYTDSESFIALLDRSTPQPPSPQHHDGIRYELFQEAVFLTRHSTVLLDPWSRTKAVSFASATSQYDAGRMIHRALNDIGHVAGTPYVVSVTRPLGMHRANPTGRTRQENPQSPAGRSDAAASSAVSAGERRSSAEQPSLRDDDVGSAD